LSLLGDGRKIAQGIKHLSRKKKKVNKRNEQEISKAQVLACSIQKQKRIEKRSGESFLEPSKQGSYPVAAAKENRME